MPAAGGAIFRRMEQEPDGSERYISKVEAVEMMGSTDSSTEILSVEHDMTQSDLFSDNKLLENRSEEEIPTLVSEGNDLRRIAGSTKSPVSFSTAETSVSIPSTPVTPDASSNSSSNVKMPDMLTMNELSLPAEEKKLAEPSDINDLADDSKDFKMKHSSEIIRPNRGRIVSLDRGQQHEIGNFVASDDGYHSTDSGMPHTDGEGRRRQYHSHHIHTNVSHRHHSIHDDDSSSDDDSSYFASNLPSPKSGRSFSLSSHGSAPDRIARYRLQKQESDASLSFSDESDDENSQTDSHNYSPHFSSKAPTTTAGVHLSPMTHPNSAVADMHLYPQRITRVHSVSSLVSSASSDNDDVEADGIHAARRRSSNASVGSLTSSGGTTVSSGPELAQMKCKESSGGCYGSRSRNLNTQTHGLKHLAGRNGVQYMNQQVDGAQQQQQQSFHLVTGTIYQEQRAASLLQSQTPSWATTMGYEYDHFSYGLQQQYYPGLFREQHFRTGADGATRRSTEQSSGNIPFVYSEDTDAAGFEPLFAMASGKGDTDAGNRYSGMPMTGTGTSGETGGSGDLGLGQRNEPELTKDSGTSEADALASSTVGVSSGGEDANTDGSWEGRQTFKVYWQRWIMLMYMSILNLLSDWTCYSVAPISLLTEEAFGSIDPERLVVVFLGANAISTACEPIILARLGLRRTVLFGALLLMIGSIVKSGGLPPITPVNLEKGHAEWSLYIGFFVVGLSQPLYQCTPALLSASWFPEKERTMATGVALNANQLGIGFAFIFGTLLVAKADDIPNYFGLLSQIATIVFIGTLIQFDDAPPTPPSSSARAMRGDLKMPRFSRLGSIVRNVRHNLSGSDSKIVVKAEAPSPATNLAVDKKSGREKKDKTKRNEKRGSSARRRATASRTHNTALTESGLAAPSSAHYGSTSKAKQHVARVKDEIRILHPHVEAPSPAMSGRPPSSAEGDLGSPDQENTGVGTIGNAPLGQHPAGGIPPGMMPMAPYGYGYPPSYQHPYYDPRMQQQMQEQQAYYQQYYQQLQVQQQQTPPGQAPPQQMPYYPPPPMMMPYGYQQFPANLQEFDPYYDPYGIDPYEDGAEPIVTITPHHLDIDIRDDQVIRSLHACMMRPGFSHALASFTVSGIVINTLSTFMDYLVRLNGAPRTYTGIVGGTFQFVIMISSLVIGKQTDKTRAYYSVTIAMLVLGAFGLAECGVSLDSDRGSDLRYSLIVVAALVGPLQPVSTELGVEVAYPLSENTVLVIQQLFSNLLSAIFIPFFKSLKDVGSTKFEDGELVERPQYTFSFYLLIVLHTGVTVYFATFNGKYLRYEHELQKEEAEDAKEQEAASANKGNDARPVHPFYANDVASSERQPLMQNAV